MKRKQKKLPPGGQSPVRPLFVFIFIFLIFTIFQRIKKTNDKFSFIAVSGLIIQFGFQIFVNIGSTIGLIPTTGTTLPFISYGGSSMISSALNLGAILSLTRIKYKDVFYQSEKEFSAYNFEHANTEFLFKIFEMVETECRSLLDKKLSLPAYDQCLKASHVFNLLDSRGAIGVAQRAGYISRIRDLVKRVGSVWLTTQT